MSAIYAVTFKTEDIFLPSSSSKELRVPETRKGYNNWQLFSVSTTLATSGVGHRVVITATWKAEQLHPGQMAAP